MDIDHAMKTPTTDLLYDFIDALRSGCSLRLHAPDNPESSMSITNIGQECVDEIAYAVEKHMRQYKEG